MFRGNDCNCHGTDRPEGHSTPAQQTVSCSRLCELMASATGSSQSWERPESKCTAVSERPCAGLTTVPGKQELSSLTDVSFSLCLEPASSPVSPHHHGLVRVTIGSLRSTPLMSGSPRGRLPKGPAPQRACAEAGARACGRHGTAVCACQLGARIPAGGGALQITGTLRKRLSSCSWV